MFPVAKRILILAFLAVAVALPGCQRKAVWHLQMPGSVLEVVAGGETLYALVEAEAGRTLVKVGPSDTVSWQVPVPGQSLRGTSRAGEVVLLANPGTGQSSLLAGDTGAIIATLETADTALSGDGQRVLAVPELSMGITLVDPTGRPLWRHLGVSDAAGDLAPLTGEVLYWDWHTVRLFSPEGRSLWRWWVPTGQWVKWAEVSADGELVRIETGDEPPYPHGARGKKRQVFMFDRTGRRIDELATTDTRLLTRGRWLEVREGELWVRRLSQATAVTIPLPPGCSQPGTKSEGEWLLVWCTAGPEPAATVFNLDGQEVWQKRLSSRDRIPMVAMAPERGLVWLAEGTTVSRYAEPASPSPVQISDQPSVQPAPRILDRSDRALAGVWLGANREEVRRILGEPAEITHSGDGSTENWQYPQGLLISFRPREGTVFSVFAQQPADGATPRSIRLGDIRTDVEQAYGQPYGGEVISTFKGAHVYASREAAMALIFGFDGAGRVDSIELRDLSDSPVLERLDR